MSKKFDFTFAALETDVMAALAKPRATQTTVLVPLLTPIWSCYIKYYLYANKVYDKHPEFTEIFSDIYDKCIDALPRVATDNYNRLKCYYNNCVSGWVRNRLYTTRKTVVQLTTDPEHWEYVTCTVSGDDYDHDVVAYTHDLGILNKHIAKEVLRYKELMLCIMPTFTRTLSKAGTTRFTQRVYAEYSKTGKLLTATAYINSTIGAMFGTNT